MAKKQKRIKTQKKKSPKKKNYVKKPTSSEGKKNGLQEINIGENTSSVRSVDNVSKNEHSKENKKDTFALEEASSHTVVDQSAHKTQGELVQKDRNSVKTYEKINHKNSSAVSQATSNITEENKLKGNKAQESAIAKVSTKAEEKATVTPQINATVETGERSEDKAFAPKKVAFGESAPRKDEKQEVTSKKGEDDKDKHLKTNLPNNFTNLSANAISNTADKLANTASKVDTTSPNKSQIDPYFTQQSTDTEFGNSYQVRKNNPEAISSIDISLLSSLENYTHEEKLAKDKQENTCEPRLQLSQEKELSQHFADTTGSDNVAVVEDKKNKELDKKTKGVSAAEELTVFADPYPLLVDKDKTENQDKLPLTSVSRDSSDKSLRSDDKSKKTSTKTKKPSKKRDNKLDNDEINYDTIVALREKYFFKRAFVLLFVLLLVSGILLVLAQNSNFSFSDPSRYLKIGDTPCPLVGSTVVEPDSSLEVTILNSTSQSGLANTVAEFFENLGYNIVNVDNTNSSFQGALRIDTTPAAITDAYTLSLYFSGGNYSDNIYIKLNSTEYNSEEKKIVLTIGAQYDYTMNDLSSNVETVNSYSSEFENYKDCVITNYEN